jgi:hypothetical protein
VCHIATAYYPARVIVCEETEMLLPAIPSRLPHHHSKAVIKYNRSALVVSIVRRVVRTECHGKTNEIRALQTP